MNIALERELKLEVRDVPEKPCLVIRDKKRVSELPGFFGMAFGKLYGFAGARTRPMEAFGRYPSPMGSMDEEIDVEAGVVTGSAIEGHGEILKSTLGGKKAVYAMHVGPYSAMEKTYEAVQTYIKEHELRPLDGMWEVYLDDPRSVPEEKMRTEIYWPVEGSRY